MAEVRKWWKVTEVRIRLEQRYGLRHRPRTAAEVGLILVNEVKKLVEIQKGL